MKGLQTSVKVYLFLHHFSCFQGLVQYSEMSNIPRCRTDVELIFFFQKQRHHAFQREGDENPFRDKELQGQIHLKFILTKLDKRGEERDFILEVKGELSSKTKYMLAQLSDLANGEKDKSQSKYLGVMPWKQCGSLLGLTLR